MVYIEINDTLAIGRTYALYRFISAWLLCNITGTLLFRWHDNYLLRIRWELRRIYANGWVRHVTAEYAGHSYSYATHTLGICPECRRHAGHTLWYAMIWYIEMNDTLAIGQTYMYTLYTFISLCIRYVTSNFSPREIFPWKVGRV